MVWDYDHTDNGDDQCAVVRIGVCIDEGAPHEDIKYEGRPEPARIPPRELYDTYANMAGPIAELVFMRMMGDGVVSGKPLPFVASSHPGNMKTYTLRPKTPIETLPPLHILSGGFDPYGAGVLGITPYGSDIMEGASDYPDAIHLLKSDSCYTCKRRGVCRGGACPFKGTRFSLSMMVNGSGCYEPSDMLYLKDLPTGGLPGYGGDKIDPHPYDIVSKEGVYLQPQSGSAAFLSWCVFEAIDARNPDGVNDSDLDDGGDKYTMGDGPDTSPLTGGGGGGGGRSEAPATMSARESLTKTIIARKRSLFRRAISPDVEGVRAYIKDSIAMFGKHRPIVVGRDFTLSDVPYGSSLVEFPPPTCCWGGEGSKCCSLVEHIMVGPGGAWALCETHRDMLGGKEVVSGAARSGLEFGRECYRFVPSRYVYSEMSLKTIVHTGENSFYLRSFLVSRCPSVFGVPRLGSIGSDLRPARDGYGAKLLGAVASIVSAVRPVGSGECSRLLDAAQDVYMGKRGVVVRNPLNSNTPWPPIQQKTPASSGVTCDIQDPNTLKLILATIMSMVMPRRRFPNGASAAGAARITSTPNPNYSIPQSRILSRAGFGRSDRGPTFLPATFTQKHLLGNISRSMRTVAQTKYHPEDLTPDSEINLSGEDVLCVQEGCLLQGLVRLQTSGTPLAAPGRATYTPKSTRGSFSIYAAVTTDLWPSRAQYTDTCYVLPHLVGVGDPPAVLSLENLQKDDGVNGTTMSSTSCVAIVGISAIRYMTTDVPLRSSGVAVFDTTSPKRYASGQP